MPVRRSEPPHRPTRSQRPRSIRSEQPRQMTTGEPQVGIGTRHEDLDPLTRSEATSSRTAETAHGNSWLMTCRCHEPAHAMCHIAHLARGSCVPLRTPCRASRLAAAPGSASARRRPPPSRRRGRVRAPYSRRRRGCRAGRRAEEALTAANLRAVFLVVRRLSVWQYVPARGVRGKVQTADLVVDLADRLELDGNVHVSLDVDRLQAVREATGLGGAVVLPHMLARPGDGQSIEQGEVVGGESAR